MPTWEAEPRFWLRWRRLTPAQQFAFQRARRLLVQGLATGRLDPRLRVKRFQGETGVTGRIAYSSVLYSRAPSR